MVLYQTTQRVIICFLISISVLNQYNFKIPTTVCFLQNIYRIITIQQLKLNSSEIKRLHCSMIDNFFQDDTPQVYQPYNRVYSHESGNHIYLGDASAANDHDFLKHAQIGLVITAATNMDQLRYQQPIKHHVYSLLDAKTQNMTVHFNHFYDMVEQHLHRSSVLVHCFAGISRSATLVISYIMRKNKIGFKQAIAEIRKYRPKVLPNLGFQRQLKQYEKALKTQQLSQTRKLISKTSQSRKHQIKKQDIALPQIFALGKTLVRSKQIEPPPLLQPSSQMESRKMRIANIDELRKFKNQGGGNSVQLEFKNFQAFTHRLPIKTFRKRSISISNKINRNIQSNAYGHIHQNIHLSEPVVELERLPPHKLAIQQLKFGTQKVIKSAILKDFY